MRAIEDHKVNTANAKIAIQTKDQPGSVPHRYLIFLEGLFHGSVYFQNGDATDVGANGITLETLIAICIDRLRCLQEGPCPRPENGMARAKLEEALAWLHARDRARQAA